MSRFTRLPLLHKITRAFMLWISTVTNYSLSLHSRQRRFKWGGGGAMFPPGYSVRQLFQGHASTPGWSLLHRRRGVWSVVCRPWPPLCTLRTHRTDTNMCFLWSALWTHLRWYHHKLLRWTSIVRHLVVSLAMSRETCFVNLLCYGFVYKLWTNKQNRL